MCHVWTFPPDEQCSIYAKYDYKNSDVDSFAISGPGFIGGLGDKGAIVLLKRRQKKSLLGLHCVPSMLRIPLIDDMLLSILKQFAQKDIQVVPVTVMLRDGECQSYVYARPLIEIPCLDLDRSEDIEWLFPGRRVYNAKKLVFREGCIENKDFVLEAFTGRVVVSNRLKDALTATGDRGLFFARPEDLQ